MLVSYIAMRTPSCLRVYATIYKYCYNTTKHFYLDMDFSIPTRICSYVDVESTLKGDASYSHIYNFTAGFNNPSLSVNLCQLYLQLRDNYFLQQIEKQ